ncbi:hypothetical protein V5R04_01670 [Jonesiaceae bacterium BS-20]|uniref:Uncharacterized protein n=1 Tax=Jonesiaceae bacterium BS-20 TaxID=3120821 RepID=A0AAU7DXL6_9MICO
MTAVRGWPELGRGAWRFTAGGKLAGGWAPVYWAAGRWGTSPVPTSIAGVRVGLLGRPEDGVKLGGGSFLFFLVASLFGDIAVPIS